MCEKGVKYVNPFTHIFTRISHAASHVNSHWFAIKFHMVLHTNFICKFSVYTIVATCIQFHMLLHTNFTCKFWVNRELLQFDMFIHPNFIAILWCTMIRVILEYWSWTRLPPKYSSKKTGITLRAHESHIIYAIGQWVLWNYKCGTYNQTAILPVILPVKRYQKIPLISKWKSLYFRY